MVITTDYLATWWKQKSLQNCENLRSRWGHFATESWPNLKSGGHEHDHQHRNTKVIVNVMPILLRTGHVSKPGITLVITILTMYIEGRMRSPNTTCPRFSVGEPAYSSWFKQKSKLKKTEFQTIYTNISLSMHTYTQTMNEWYQLFICLVKLSVP